MQREATLGAILQQKLIGIVRLGSATDVVPVVRAIQAGGIGCIEVSLTTPDALSAIAAIRERLPEVRVGAGTVLSGAELAACVEAGARFVVTPVTIPELVEAAHALDVPVVMGAFTPTEIHLAHAAGADLVKLFPAASLEPGYLRAVRAPFPGVRLVPTGGIDASNARAWLDAGAVALGVGGTLTEPGAVAAGRFDELAGHARRLVQAVGR